MKAGSSRCWGIFLTCGAGALLVFAQPAVSQEQSGVRSVPSAAEVTAAALLAEQEAEAAKYKDKQDRFTYGKRHETVATTDETGTIQKTKHGSSDATVPTGVFKESFLDVGLSSKSAPKSSPTPSAQVNPIHSATTAAQLAASPQPSPSPATAAPAPSAPARLDITLGVDPAAPALNATATPKPQ